MTSLSVSLSQLSASAFPCFFLFPHPVILCSYHQQWQENCYITIQRPCQRFSYREIRWTLTFSSSNWDSFCSLVGNSEGRVNWIGKLAYKYLLNRITVVISDDFDAFCSLKTLSNFLLLLGSYKTPVVMMALFLDFLSLSSSF